MTDLTPEEKAANKAAKAKEKAANKAAEKAEADARAEAVTAAEEKLAELNAQIAEAEKVLDKPADPVVQEDTVTVQCICSNVHLGNGHVLRAKRDGPNSNWEDGDTAMLPRHMAEILAKKKQVKIL